MWETSPDVDGHKALHYLKRRKMKSRNVFARPLHARAGLTDALVTYKLTQAEKIAISFGMAGFTGLLAQIYIPLPFTPVPITGQVLGPLLSGVVCGPLYGGLSQIIYLLLGLAGVPWFAGGTGGYSKLFSPTFGYFLGFIFASFLIGKYIDRDRNFFSRFQVMLFGVTAIYTFGAIFFSISTRSGPSETFYKAVLPFVPFDILKALLATSIIKCLKLRI